MVCDLFLVCVANADHRGHKTKPKSVTITSHFPFILSLAVFAEPRSVDIMKMNSSDPTLELRCCHLAIQFLIFTLVMPMEAVVTV